MQKRTSQFIAAIAAAFAVVGILVYVVAPVAADPQAGQHKHAVNDAAAEVTRAVATVQPLGDSGVEGTVTFTKQQDGVLVEAKITGLDPGEHGFHIHQYGECSMPSGECAGGHFNPTNEPHGAPEDEKRHVGDLGNIKAGQDGTATYKRVDKVIALNGPRSIIGRSVIVHAGRDDLESQPSGDAGARVGCGVIGIAGPEMEH